MVGQFINRLKLELKNFFYQNSILAILLFGSFAKNGNDERSDIDICIVCKDDVNQVNILLNAWKVIGGKYDVWLFNELPGYIQFDILDNHKIILCDDEVSLFEYFYYYRKLKQDYLYRVKVAEGEY